MPQINGTGPEGKGPKTGRGLGKCKKNSSEGEINKLGKGLGKRRKSGGGTGKGKRLKSGLK
ncbi:MAG: DUF5320 domain-containing protein [Bacteroidales bacterium]|nr:DUF5320 domain-containing protein [Bacteroidales bacterium]